MTSLPRTPPIEPALEIAADLGARGLACALGGSGLLAALGLESDVRDWDLTTDAPLAAVVGAAAGRSYEMCGSSGIHADSKLMFKAARLELIVGFAVVGGRGPCRLPTVVTGSWRGLPLGSPEAWAVAYELMGRAAKAQRLFEHLARHGASAATIGRLLAEPLPAALADRLRALPA